MQNPIDIVQQAIDSVSKLRKTIGKASSRQVTATAETLAIKAVVKAWFNSLRPAIATHAVVSLLVPIDTKYNLLMEHSEKSTSRKVYKNDLQELKAELIRFRSQINILTSTGQIQNYQKPDFSKLISDKTLILIVERRWQEATRCIEVAPFTATIMIGALLEALLLARVNQEPDKKKLFRLECIRKDKSGKPCEMSQWGLNDYLNVCFAMGWIRRPVKDVGSVMKDYRNFIHPREELKHKISINGDDAKMYWAIFATMVDQIVSSI